MFLWTGRLLICGRTLPFASGIIDDLIVKAKVFGAGVGHFLSSFREKFGVAACVVMH